MSTIVVLVKQVPDTNAKIAVQGDRVDLASVKMEMSPYDGFAIETALRHKEATGGTVTALTVGAAGTEKILKDAKAMGVDPTRPDEFYPTRQHFFKTRTRPGLSKTRRYPSPIF